MTEISCKNNLIELFESVDDGKEEADTIFDKVDGKLLNVNYEFEPFNKTERVRYGYWFELHFIPAPSVQKELGREGMNEWKGLFQIDICVYKSLQIDNPAAKISDYFDNCYAAIAEVMRRGVIYNGVRILRVYNSSAIDNDTYYTMPVTVEWMAHLRNKE